MGRSMAEWYVECMFIWRLAVPPLFRLSGLLGTPKVLPLLVVCAASYAAASHSTLPDPLEFEFHTVAIRMCFPWRMLVLNAPFFGAGLLFSPDGWSELMDKRHVVPVAYILFAVFGLASLWPPPFGAHSWEALLGSSLGVCAVKSVTLVFVTTCIIGSWLQPLKHVAPSAVDYLIRCSRRSLQAFNLHWALFVLLGGRLGLASLARKLLPLGTASQAVIFTVASFWLTLVLSSRLADCLFGWLLNLPVQLVEILNQYVETNNKALQKALEAFGPVQPLASSWTPSTYVRASMGKKHMNRKSDAAAAVARALLITEATAANGK